MAESPDLKEPKEALNILFWSNVRLILDYKKRGLSSSSLAWNILWLRKIASIYWPERDIDSIIYPEDIWIPISTNYASVS